MAHIIIFPDQRALELAAKARSDKSAQRLMYPPEFCQGLMPACIYVTGGAKSFLEKLRANGVLFSGVIEHSMFNREIPQAPPPDSQWKTVLGNLQIVSVKQSLTDPIRFRVEIIPEKSLVELIPIMARFIRGGAFNPRIPVLTFEEEHRLISFSPNEIVFCRVDDLLDLWKILRTSVDLILTAWNRRFIVEPETELRQGIGAVEIFKRLPATNCGRCNNATCVEFATGLITGRCSIEQCIPLFERDQKYAESLKWLLIAIGLDTSLQRQPELAPHRQNT